MAYGLTKSINFVKASTQCAYVADNTAFDFGNTFTIEVWARASSLPASGANHALVGKWLTSGDQRSYVFRLNNTSGTYTLQMVTDADGAAGGSTIVSSSSLTVSTGTWYHFSAAVSSGTVTFYQDGVSVGGGGGLATPLSGSAGVAVGAERIDGTDGWDGYISLVRMWKGEARSITDIANNRCSVLGATTNLSAEWTLNDTYADNSGNGFTLTGLNSPTFVSSVPSVCAASFSISETLALTESTSNLRARLFSTSETLSLSETISALKGLSFSVAESLGLVEAYSYVWNKVFNVADSLGLVELSATISKKWENITKNNAVVSNINKNNASVSNISKNEATNVSNIDKS